MYEIPQQLEYKERIVFGLTFGQIMYAMIFLPIIIIIFRMNIPLPVKVFLMLIPICLAGGFMFFDLYNKMKDWYWWYKFREIRDSAKIEILFDARINEDLIFTK